VNKSLHIQKNKNISECNLKNDKDTLYKIKCIEILKDYIKTMPFDKYDIECLLKSVNREIDMIEYRIKRELGEKEFEKVLGKEK